MFVHDRLAAELTAFSAHDVMRRVARGGVYMWRYSLGCLGLVVALLPSAVDANDTDHWPSPAASESFDARTCMRTRDHLLDVVWADLEAIKAVVPTPNHGVDPLAKDADDAQKLVGDMKNLPRSTPAGERIRKAVYLLNNFSAVRNGWEKFTASPTGQKINPDVRTRMGWRVNESEGQILSYINCWSYGL